MLDLHIRQAPTLFDLPHDAVKLLQRHGFERFIFQLYDRTAVHVVAHDAVEGADAAVAGPRDPFGQRVGIDGLGCQPDVHAPPETGGITASSSPSSKTVCGGTNCWLRANET